jgi:diguanylate cyclase (GGDEF)-like protein
MAVMLPVVALSTLGVVGVAQRYREADTISGVSAHVARVALTMHLYAGLVAEKTGSGLLAVASSNGFSPTRVSRLMGIDVEAQLRSARAAVDAAIADGAGTILGKRVGELLTLRARIDAGTASETSMRSFFADSIDVAESAWLAQVSELTRESFKAVDSGAIRSAIAGLTDSVDAFISGAKAATAAGALSVPGVPGAATGATDLAAAYAVYTQATSGLGAELSGQSAAAWQHLIVIDPDVNRFRQFLTTLLQRPSDPSAGANLAEIARTFRGGLIFQDHLRQVVDAAAAEVLRLTDALRNGARQALWRYLFALGLVGACSVAVAITTARRIVRPLRRLAVRASEVSLGVIDGDPLDATGPDEIASVSATFNEIVANLTALDTSALALAAADLDSPVLATSVPGRIGDSLRHSVDLLKQSIRDNEELRRNLELNEARFRELAERSPDVIWRFSRHPEPHFEYLSPSFEALTGIPTAAAEADFDLLAAALDPDGQALIADMAAGRHFQAHADLRFRRRDGAVVVFELRTVETPDGTQGIGRDVTEVRALQAQLAEQATRDPLTGLANRRLLDELLGRALRRADRSRTRVTLAFLDLDNFKSVNDTYGHDAGDAVLRATADRLLTAVRGADVVARYGGDEFVVVYEGADDEAGESVAERIDDAFRTPIDIGGGVAVRCPPSVGVADTRSTAANPAALISAADRAMLDVKKARTPSPRRDVRHDPVRLLE